jgi:hypothetical protein
MPSRACPLRSDSGGGDRSEAETLGGRGAAAPFLPPIYLRKIRGLEEGMQQPQLTTYADIAEVRAVTGAAACNQLLADGYVLLGVIPLTTVGKWQQGKPEIKNRTNGSRTPSGMSDG